MTCIAMDAVGGTPSVSLCGVPLMNVRDETELVPPGVGRACDVNKIKFKSVPPANNSGPGFTIGQPTTRHRAGTRPFWPDP